jgi:hypothetical protein
MTAPLYEQAVEIVRAPQSLPTVKVYHRGSGPARVVAWQSPHQLAPP